jgi:glycosyltransferase involved in cell wall biosynthesis
MDNLLVSVVTIVRNGEYEIEETIKSVLKQNYKHIEYIIIDGNSTDNTMNIINRYKNNISYIVSEADFGIFDAINKGVQIASGDLIGLIHSGDSYEPNTIKIVAETFIKTNADIIYGDMYSKEVIDAVVITKRHIANHTNLKNKMSIFHPSTFIKRKCYKEIGLYNTKYLLAADYDYLLKLYLLGKHFHHINKPLAIFLTGGLSGSNFSLSVKDNFNIRKQNLSVGFAVKYATNQILSYCFFSLRKKIIEFFIGKSNYTKLKAKKFEK